MNYATIFTIAICTLSIQPILAQKNYTEVGTKIINVPQRILDIIQNAGYTYNYDYYTNNYVGVYKNDHHTKSDTLGNIIQFPKGLELFDASKKGNVFTYTLQHISMDLQRGNNIQLFKIDGIATTKIKELKEYYFSFAPGSLSKAYFTDYGDYVTVCKEINGVQKIGLLMYDGSVTIEPAYDAIEYVGGKCFSVKKDNQYYLYDVVAKKMNPIAFEEIELRLEGGSGKYYYMGKTIVKKDGKYGLYDINANKWAIPNTYDKLTVISDNIVVHQNTPNVTLIDVVYTDIFIVENNGQVGAVNDKNQIIIPLQYTKLSYAQNGKNYFMVYNQQGQYNYYNAETKTEVLKGFYKEIYIDEKNIGIVFGKENLYWKMFNTITNEVLIDEKDKIVSIYFDDYRPLFFITFEDKTVGLYNPEISKFIVKNEARIGRVNDCKSYYNITKADIKNYIIDIKGNILVPPLYTFNGAVKLQNGHFVVYNANKPSKIFDVYNMKGEEVDKKKFLEGK